MKSNSRRADLGKKLQVSVMPDSHLPDLSKRHFMASNMAAAPQPHQLPHKPPSPLPSGLSVNALARQQAAGHSLARDAGGQRRVIAPLSGEPDQIGMSLAGRSFLD